MNQPDSGFSSSAALVPAVLHGDCDTAVIYSLAAVHVLPEQEAPTRKAWHLLPITLLHGPVPL